MTLRVLCVYRIYVYTYISRAVLKGTASPTPSETSSISQNPVIHLNSPQEPVTLPDVLWLLAAIQGCVVR